MWVGGMRTSTTARSGWWRSTAVEQLVGVADGGHHVLAGVDQEAGEPGSQEHGVLGDHDAHGSSTEMVVGPPGGLITCSVPPSAVDPVAQALRARCRRTASAPPTPSSRTSMTSRSPGRPMATPARVASAWRATLVSASVTMK